MDRRVFQPRPNSSAERRRNALGMSILILIVGWLWLQFERIHAPSVPAQAISARPIPKN